MFGRFLNFMIQSTRVDAPVTRVWACGIDMNVGGHIVNLNCPPLLMMYQTGMAMMDFF